MLLSCLHHGLCPIGWKIMFITAFYVLIQQLQSERIILAFYKKKYFFVLISTKYSLRHWTVVPHGFPCVSPCDDAYFIQTCICFWQIDFIMWISVKHITFMVGNEHEKLSPASVNVVNWVAELIQLKTGRIKRFYFKLDYVLGASSRGRGHNNLFTEAWAYAILNHVWIC